MKVLVVGSGGREHALVWKISQSAAGAKIYCAPGNAGIAEQAELVPIGADQIEKISEFAARAKVDLTVVGPELPLTLGIVDLFESRGLKIFGPDRAAARLEGSKVFAKELLAENGIPTAPFRVFEDEARARAYLEARPLPCVVKADGLAAGKGVMVCTSAAEAKAAVEQLMVQRVFGSAGETIIVEDFLEGEEASFMALVDGENYLPLASSQDHKRAFDGDRGPNTGGMGAYSPAPILSRDAEERVAKEILKPLMRGLTKRGIRYRGVLYIGLMVTADGPKVLEFNCRFGDPECQAVVMRLEDDLLSLFEATIAGRLDQARASWSDEAAACVVLCAGGYPGPFEKGKPIKGLEKLKGRDKVAVFHAGTAFAGGQWLTAGGRVLGVTARGASLSDALAEAYRAVAEIEWEGMHYRRDIGWRALK
ncbi:MAG TPA: phosphoribosylamine--glycine ligase [Candidatus Acidoferrales bacterium]|nr:phosphoribosylamine--glycine ligase [Candidatus Acidoferrales bacterium]